MTGFSALGLQVVWQRIVSLHVGADTVATAIVVSGFLAGLGIGNVVGGRVADRVTRPAALRVVAAAELGVAAFAMVSTWALHDLFVDVAPSLSGASLGRAMTFLILLVPTTLMGMSLPLVADAVAPGPWTASAGRSDGSTPSTPSAGRWVRWWSVGA